MKRNLVVSLPLVLAVIAASPATQNVRTQSQGEAAAAGPIDPPLPEPHVGVSAVAIDPNAPTEVWVCNRGNDSVSVIDTATQTAVAEIAVGVWPRAIAFSADGSTAFVTNQRGNVPVTTHFVTPFTGSEVRGSVSVIDVATRTVTSTLTNVGTEPYGVAVAPNGAWFAVSGFRSGTMKFYSTVAPYAELLSFQFDRDVNFIAPGKTIADVDSNKDFVADQDEPRAFVIENDSRFVHVAHALPGFVSVLRLTLDVTGEPTAVVLDQKISLDGYAPHPIFNPVPVQTIASQGEPRFLDDIALSLTGRFAIVPHVLHNVNHDVNHDFGPGLAGDFANRVYPAVSVVDTLNGTFARKAATGETLGLEFEPADIPEDPAVFVPYGGQGFRTSNGILTLGGVGAPVLGADLELIFTGSNPNDEHIVFWSTEETAIPLRVGTLLNRADAIVPFDGRRGAIALPDDPQLAGKSIFLQGAVVDPNTGALRGLTNGVRAVLGTESFAAGSMGFRAGHPGRVLFNREGDRVVVLNRGSEDVFLYKFVNGSLTFMNVFPPRVGFVERAPLDTATPMGDLPLGMALLPDDTTLNRDAVLYVVNETTRTLSSLRIDFDAGTIAQETGQIDTLLGADQMTLSERVGQELFEDASRAQTAGNFNNSCASCHFEGGADGNIWQRPAGPRSTMPVYGGTLLTGLILWKGVRINMGETGPMFGGENGGTGVLTDDQQQGLTDYHEIIPVPLNPNLDPVTGAYSTGAALGKDLFFGTDDTGLNMSLRSAGCASCHPDFDTSSMTVRGYTADFLNPLLTSGDNLESLDPNCFSLRESTVQLNVRNVNSGVNVDIDGNGSPDVDRNADGFSDIESYTPMNVDTNDDFTRDDTNGYMCPEVPGMPGSPLRVFGRDRTVFSIPTKLGVFSTGPYFHDHVAVSLRTLLDPQLQTTDPVYGDPSLPHLSKFFNEFHDVRGNELFAPGASKVQQTLQTLANGSTIEADVEALLEYISSL